MDDAERLELNMKDARKRLFDAEEQIIDLEAGLVAVTLGFLRLTADALGFSEADMAGILRERAREVASALAPGHRSPAGSRLAAQFEEAAALIEEPPRE
jgi:hypothetical protein